MYRGGTAGNAAAHLSHKAGQSRPTHDKNTTGRRRPGRQHEQIFKIRRAAFYDRDGAVLLASYLALGLHVMSFRAGARRRIGCKCQPQPYFSLAANQLFNQPVFSSHRAAGSAMRGLLGCRRAAAAAARNM
jgi:hypothetical protein